MAHTIQNKEKLLNRVRRIRGQVEGIERALEADKECDSILQTVAACRGALNSLMAEIIDGHIRSHVLSTNGAATEEQARAAEVVIDVVRAYLK